MTADANEVFSDETIMEMAHTLCRYYGGNPLTLVSVCEPYRVRAPAGLAFAQDADAKPLGDLWFDMVKAVVTLIEVRAKNAARAI